MINFSMATAGPWKTRWGEVRQCCAPESMHSSLCGAWCLVMSRHFKLQGRAIQGLAFQFVQTSSSTFHSITTSLSLSRYIYIYIMWIKQS